DHTLVETLWAWIPGGSAELATGAARFSVDWAYQVDPLSSVMLLVVTFVGFFIHLYSIGYMGFDAGYARYMAYLNLFMFAMLTLVLGANYPMLFVGCARVGLCSYLLIGLCLFVGACGKSAQIPLFTWLPDAMEGPTPVSALIHAATMVTAGVYMVARSSAIYVHAPKAMFVVAVIGAGTAVLAATIGLVQ